MDNNRFAACDLISAIQKKRDPAASAKDAMIVLDMIYGIYESALSGKRVTLPGPGRNHPLTAET